MQNGRKSYELFEVVEKDHRGDYGVDRIAEKIMEELQTNSRKLIDTLNSFGVNATITNICRGPSVTRYELQPAPGVKISKITNLSDDIALNLAANGVRIEAPIPGKAAVGIEVPNKVVSMVGQVPPRQEQADCGAGQGYFGRDRPHRYRQDAAPADRRYHRLR